MDQLSDSGQAGAQIELTDAMIDAGERELCDHAPYFEERALASMIYRAMELAKYQTPQS